MQALIIKTDGSSEAVEYSQDTEYDTLSAAVGGYVESIRLRDDATLWLNEEGKLLDLPLNVPATLLFQHYVGPSDFIVGPVIITGGIDEEGYTKTLTQEVLDKMYDEVIIV